MTWPYSAAATKVLLSERARLEDLMPLAYKELVLREAVRLEKARRRFLTTRHQLTPASGAVPLPRELEQLAATLRTLFPSGEDLHRAVQRVAAKTDGDERLKQGAVQVLLDAGVLERQKRRFFGTRLVRTAEGAAAAARFGQLRDTSVPAVVLLGDRRYPEIDAALRRLDAEGFSASFDGIDGACHDGGGGSDGGCDGGDGGGGGD